MLGNSAIKDYVNSSHSLDIKPRVFLEFNGNDYGDPYFYGTGLKPSSNFNDFDLNLNNRTYSPAPQSGVDAGLSIAMSENTDTAFLIDVDPGGSKFYEHGYYSRAPVGVKNIKFNMFLKSDYINKVNLDDEYLESFDVVFFVYGIDSSGKRLTSETVTETVTVNSIDWKPVSILFSNPDDTDLVDRVVLNIFISLRSGEKIALLVDKLCYVDISSYEVFVKDRLPLGTVFDLNRPGEFLVDTPLAERPTIAIDDENIPQQPTQVHMAMSYALGPKYSSVQRSVTPYPENPNSYYVSGSTLNSKKVWTLYKNKINTNKIVIKTNAIAVKPSSFTLSILDSSSGWTSNLISTEEFDDNGLLILYYDGSSWSSTPPSTDSYPHFDLTAGGDSGDIVINNNIAYKTIHGISLEVNSFSVTNEDFSDLTDISKRLELIEISPRLEIDVTNLVYSVNLNKEISDSETSLFFSGISSNSYAISLSNVGILQGDGSYINPLNTNFSGSPIYNILRRMVKVRGGFDIDTTNSETGVNNTKYYSPAFVGYLDSWNLSDVLQLTCFDSIKLLQNIKTPSIYLSSARVAECLFSVLDAAGFSETYAEDISRLRILSRESTDLHIPSEKINHYWTDKDLDLSETINQISKLFQFGMYCDEYGGVRIKSLYTFNNLYRRIMNGARDVDLYIQDYNDNNSLSNIVGSPNFTDMTIPSKLAVKYYQPHPPNDLIAVKESDSGTPTSTDPTLKTVTNIVWENSESVDVLPFIEIGLQGINGIHQNWIPYNTELVESALTTIPFSSYLLIDQEIVHYDGIEYEFIYTLKNNSIVRKTVKIKSPEEIESVSNSIFSEKTVKRLTYRPTGKLVNVKRGLFGTVPSRHIRRTSSTDNPWKVREFNISSAGYTNMSSPSRSTGKFGYTIDGFKLNSSSESKVLFMYPNDDETDINLLKNKKRMRTLINLSDVPAQKSGAAGIGVGIEINETGQIVNGMIVWLTIDVKKKKQQPNIYIEQIVNGTKKVLLTRSDFKYDELLFNENENVEIFIGLHKNNSQARVLVGGTSVYQKEITDPKNDKKVTGVDYSFNLLAPLRKNSTFGVFAKGSMSVVLDTMQFGVSRDPQDMNDLDIYNLDDDYQPKYSKRPNSTYFIGNESLLNNMVSNQLIAGISQNSGSNFVYTGSVVGRGIKIYEVDYDPYPITTTPEFEFTGYTYDFNALRSANLVGESFTTLSREAGGPA